MKPDLQALLDEIDRQSIEARRYPESAQFEEIFEHTGQLAQAVRAVLGVLDDYPLPDRTQDPTGYTTARIELLEDNVREAITEALGSSNGNERIMS